MIHNGDTGLLSQSEMGLTRHLSLFFGASSIWEECAVACSLPHGGVCEFEKNQVGSTNET
jgi:hypothetical protein